MAVDRNDSVVPERSCVAAAGGTFFEVLRQKAAADSSFAAKNAFTYLNDGEHISGSISFSELDRAARGIAANLQRLTQPGDRVLLVLPPSLDYIIAFFGCIYAGVVAVPALPPANSRTFPRLQFIARDAAPTAAIGS